MRRDLAILSGDLERDGLGDARILRAMTLGTNRSRVGSEDGAKLTTRHVRADGLILRQCDIGQARQEDNPSSIVRFIG
jgi:hypothetical protein